MDWDERFRVALERQGGDPDPPAPWLVAHAELLAARAPGRAADVACGLGRHARLPAELGFAVDAVDDAAFALDFVERDAHRRGLDIRVHRIDLRARPHVPRPPYAVIVVTNYLQRDLLPVLAAALEPGGLLAVEAFVAHPAPEWGPRHPEHVVAPGELRDLLATTPLVHYAEAPHSGRVKARALAAAPGGDGV